MPPGWSGAIPANVVRVDAPTPYVWIIGRTKTDGSADYDAVHKIQAGLKVVPISRFSQAVEKVVGTVDPGVDMKTPPKTQVDTMPAGKFFAYAAEILKVRPPRISDEPTLAQMRRIWIERGKSFDIDELDPAIKTCAGDRAQRRPGLDGVEGRQPHARRERLVDEYRLDGCLRQLLPEARDRHPAWPRHEPAGGRDLSDQSRRDTGKPLDGADHYVLHFESSVIPPVNAFWSVTLYDAEGYQVPNSLNRFAVSLQNQSPGADKEANWLPAPKGPFNLTMRLYAPKSDALTGKWNPPPVMKSAAPTLLPAR